MTSEASFGASAKLCDFVTAEQLRKLRPSSVVDFGAGGGKNGRIVREVLGSHCVLVGVEGYAPAAHKLADSGAYDRVDEALIQDWVDRDTDVYAAALFGDVIEHMRPREIRKVIKKCLDKFEHVIIVVPLHDIFQDDAYGNPLEVHQAYITSDFFDRYRPVEKHIIDGGRYTLMNVLIHAKRLSRPLGARVMWGAFHFTMLVLQPLGLARPLVNLLKTSARRHKWLIGR